MSEIVIDAFTVTRGNFTLKPVSMHIKNGEIFALLGRTGSGKTVLLEAMSGMFPGDSGSILYDGTDITHISPENRKIGFVYQTHALFPHMKVQENIAYGLKMHGFSRAEQHKKVSELMDLLSISHISEQYPGTLSGGESQRTALARALAVTPETLLLDEPFSALDYTTRQTLYQEILKIHDRFHCTIVFVTHNFQEAMFLADRIGILLDGELKTVTTASSLMEQSYSEEVEIFLGKGKKNHE